MRDIRFTYLLDPTNTERILTLAREKTRSGFNFGWALCRPRSLRGDLHSKKEGRRIAILRMKGAPFSCILNKVWVPLSMLQVLAEEKKGRREGKVAQRILKEVVKNDTVHIPSGSVHGVMNHNAGEK